MPILRACLLCVLVLLPRLADAACTPIAEGAPRVMRAAAGSDALTVTFLGHASFLIETPGGVRAVTDYNGYNAPVLPPDVATMNHAHSTHYTDQPDARIPHVLRGWSTGATPPQYNLDVGDLHVRNLPTNIRNWSGGTEIYGNSIFLFEAAGLCVAHLGHLHHLLTSEDLAILGHVDVVMAPVDGVYTMSQQDVAAVIEQIRPRLVLPMHYFMRDVAVRFVELMRDRYEVRFADSTTLQISRAMLPDRPTIVVLAGGY